MVPASIFQFEPLGYHVHDMAPLRLMRLTQLSMQAALLSCADPSPPKTSVAAVTQGLTVNSEIVLPALTQAIPPLKTQNPQVAMGAGITMAIWGDGHLEVARPYVNIGEAQNESATNRRLLSLREPCTRLSLTNKRPKPSWWWRASHHPKEHEAPSWMAAHGHTSLPQKHLDGMR